MSVLYYTPKRADVTTLRNKRGCTVEEAEKALVREAWKDELERIRANAGEEETMEFILDWIEGHT